MFRAIMQIGTWLARVNFQTTIGALEGTFVHDNSLGSQPAGSGYLPVGVGFYRKEFEIPRQTKGKKYPLNLTEFSGIAPFG